MFLYRPLLKAPRIKTALVAFYFPPQVRECCLPRTSEGQTRREPSKGLEFVFCFFFLNVKVNEFPGRWLHFPPLQWSCVSDRLPAMTEIPNALYVQGSVLGNGDIEISKTGSALLMKSAVERKRKDAKPNTHARWKVDTPDSRWGRAEAVCWGRAMQKGSARVSSWWWEEAFEAKP